MSVMDKDVGTLISSAVAMSFTSFAAKHGRFAAVSEIEVLLNRISAFANDIVEAFTSDPRSLAIQQSLAQRIDERSVDEKLELLEITEHLLERLSQGLLRTAEEARYLRSQLGAADIPTTPAAVIIDVHEDRVVAYQHFEPNHQVPRPELKRVAIVPVWYATDRKKTGSLEPSFAYSAERSFLSYGVAEITIPIDRHTIGELEQPSLWRLELREDPLRHITVKSLASKSEKAFFRNLRRRIVKDDAREAFLFVHGYNVNFRDAARRAGQMAWDLKFSGAPILDSWPSQARVKAYAVDSTNAEWTTANFEHFLWQLVEYSGAKTIHLIAHSMGNRLLLRALQRFTGTAGIFREIILAAPDIDKEVFLQIAREIGSSDQRVTLYASSRDRALQLSKYFNGYPRAGDTSAGVTIAHGVDTIDATAVNTSLMGHSYVGEVRTVLSDLFYLLRGIPVMDRVGIRPSADGTHWVFQP